MSDTKLYPQISGGIVQNSVAGRPDDGHLCTAA